MSNHPRITLISGLPQSPEPAGTAMREVWPEARFNNLVDNSLASDLTGLGGITSGIVDRFLRLGRYAFDAHGGQGPTRGILFTCSAFGPAIDRVKHDLSIPVLSPNEGAFDEALAICAGIGRGARVGLLLTFAGSVEPLRAEMEMAADRHGQRRPELMTGVAAGALEALQRGDTAEHDRLIADAAAAMPAADVLILGQFSMARSASLVISRRPETVLTTPQSAVRKLRHLVESAPLKTSSDRYATE